MEEEDGRFEIKDFTVISEWERLTNDLESLIKKWKWASELTAKGNTEENPMSASHTATILYKDIPLTLHLVRERKEIDILKGMGRFSVASTVTTSLDEANIGFIQRSFDLMSFFLLRCSPDSVISLPTARLMLASLIMALRSCQYCESLPILIEYGECSIMGVRLEDPRINDVSLFSLATIRSSLSESLSQTLYKMLSSRPKSEYRYSYAQCLSLPGRSIQLKLDPDENKLDWGSANVIESMELQQIFPQLPNAIDNFVPDKGNEAPIWMLSVNKKGLQPSILSEFIRQITHLAILSNEEQRDPGELIHHKTRMLHLLSISRNHKVDSERFFRNVFFSSGRSSCRLGLRIVKGLLLYLQGTSFAETKKKMLTDFPRLWAEFLQVLKESWETLEPIPFADSIPNLELTLLDQKLAMLNYCIEYAKRLGIERTGLSSDEKVGKVKGIFDSISDSHAKSLEQERRVQADAFKAKALGKGKEAISKISGTFQALQFAISPGQDEPNECIPPLGANLAAVPGGDDGFYDVLEFGDWDVIPDQIQSLLESASEPVLIDVEPRGRKRKHPTLTLINDPSEPLWIPFTQEAGIMTGDWARVHEEAIMAGGHNKLRVQGEHLLSDMQAFKAANPKSDFIDFVRWHSPRDWSEGEGQLSKRMITTDNIWLQLWSRCAPIPIEGQQLLFDPIKEGERALFWFEDASLYTLFESILPLMLECISETLGYDPLPLKGRCISEEYLEELCHALRIFENQETFRATVRAMFSNGSAMEASQLADLLEGKPILVAEEGHRQKIWNLFAQSKTATLEREYCLESEKESLYLRYNESSDWLDIACISHGSSCTVASRR